MRSISVIIPTHNDHQHLAEALASISAQATDDLQVIVVDDGSDTPVEALVRDVIPGALVLTQDNGGPSAARNHGLRHASGEYIAFLDADDRWVEGALENFRKAYRDASRADIVQGLVRRFRDGTKDDLPLAREFAQLYVGFNLGAAMVRRQVLGADPFDERLWHSEDVDLFMRLHDRGAKRLVVPQHVLDYRRHPRSLTASLTERSPGREAAGNWIRLLHVRRTAGRPVEMASASALTDARISVLLVVRNGRKYLPAALECIRRQTLAPFEILALVGQSEDGTSSYLEAQSDVRLVSQAGSGLADARNQALVEARGELIAFYDHDDLWDAHKLQRQSEVLALFAAPSASITSFRLVEDADPDDPAAVTDIGPRIPRLGWTPSAFLAHRDVYRQVGAFDGKLGMGCDTDWFRRLKLSGIGCGLAPQTLLRKRIHGDNLSARPATNRAAMFRLLHKHRTERRNRDHS